MGQEDRLAAQREIARLFEQYADEICRYADYCLGNRTDAEDVVQEVFFRVVRGWRNFRHDSGERTWLWSITRRCVQDVFRRQAQRRDAGQMDQVAVPSASAECDFGEVGSGWQRIDLERCLRSLPLPMRQVLVLRMIEDLSVRETATALGWSGSKVRTTLHRAVRKLRWQMTDAGEVGNLGEN